MESCRMSKFGIYSKTSLSRKVHVDFLLVLIELFSLGVMAEALHQFKIGNFAPVVAG